MSINRKISDVYIKVINVLVIAALLILNLSSFIALKELDSSSSHERAFAKMNIVQFKYNIILEVALLSIIFLIDVFIIKRYYDRSNAKKVEKQSEKEVGKYQKEIEVQYKVLEKIASLYDNTVKCTNQKSEFFYNMSHELKTPLTVILGAIQLIEQKNSSIGIDRRRSSKHLSTIKQNCYRLLRLINNILDLSRIESGYIKTNMVNCNIVYLIEEITQSVIPYAEQKRLTLEFDTSSEVITTSVDIDKIERIILNLLSNAIKYTNSGGKISVNVISKNNKILISVKDTGIGIPKNMLDSVFERYRQVDSSLTKGIEGSGLGLSIVKSFVELHNGSIKVKSEPNKGSEFSITLPVQLCESSESISEDTDHKQTKIIEAINIEFSEIYTIAS